MTKSQFKELIVYIAKRCADDADFGVTKLNKLLFFTDFFYYLQHGESLTGKDYVNQQFGPVPEGMAQLRKEMEKLDIALAIGQSGPFTQHRVVALREPNISNIDPQRLAFLDGMIDEICHHNKVRATWLSRHSHDYIGWDVTQPNEKIPYQTIFLKEKPKQVLTERDLQHGQELARIYGSTYVTEPA